MLHFFRLISRGGKKDGRYLADDFVPALNSPVSGVSFVAVFTLAVVAEADSNTSDVGGDLLVVFAVDPEVRQAVELTSSRGALHLSPLFVGDKLVLEGDILGGEHHAKRLSATVQIEVANFDIHSVGRSHSTRVS